MKKRGSLKEAYRFGIQKLKEAGISEAELDSWYLLEKVTGVDKAAYYGNPDKELKEEEWNAYLSFLNERENRVPLQYILEEQVFYGRTFYVNPQVLIPRWETEALVEEAKQRCKWQGRVLELCTGSGCVILSLKKERPDIEAVGSDISRGALQVARKNAKELEAEVFFLQSDLFEKVEKKFDLILANPPYIPTEEISFLEPEVRLFEPHLALDGKEDGLSFYRRIIEEGRKYLNNQGYLLFEIGYNQGEVVSQEMKKAGFVEVEIKKDLAGLDRIILGMYNRG